MKKFAFLFFVLLSFVPFAFADEVSVAQTSKGSNSSFKPLATFSTENTINPNVSGRKLLLGAYVEAVIAGKDWSNEDSMLQSEDVIAGVNMQWMSNKKFTVPLNVGMNLDASKLFFEFGLDTVVKDIFKTDPPTTKWTTTGPDVPISYSQENSGTYADLSLGISYLGGIPINGNENNHWCHTPRVNLTANCSFDDESSFGAYLKVSPGCEIREGEGENGSNDYGFSLGAQLGIRFKVF